MPIGTLVYFFKIIAIISVPPPDAPMLNKMAALSAGRKIAKISSSTGSVVNGAFAKYVNPENRQLLNSLAPVWLVTSHNDFLRRYTTDFEKALTRAEREHELVVFPKNKKPNTRSAILMINV